MKLHSYRKAKIHRVYDESEVREMYNVSRNTPRNWVRQGLVSFKHKGKGLFRGDELNRFHRQRWLNSKNRPCGVDELFCLACKTPKHPADDVIEFEEWIVGSGLARARCPDCGKAITRLIGAVGLERMRATLTVNTRPLEHD